jgi:hypothetical protein
MFPLKSQTQYGKIMPWHKLRTLARTKLLSLTHICVSTTSSLGRNRPQEHKDHSVKADFTNTASAIRFSTVDVEECFWTFQPTFRFTGPQRWAHTNANPELFYDVCLKASTMAQRPFVVIDTRKYVGINAGTKNPQGNN